MTEDRDGFDLTVTLPAAELADMRLPGPPTAKGAITRLARREGWRTRVAGERNEYHFSTLPRKAFETLIDRVIAPAVGVDEPGQVPAFSPPPPVPEAPATGTAPPWLLPLMRVIRTEAPATVREVMGLLPRYPPKGVAPPTVEDVLPELRRLGMFQ